MQRIDRREKRKGSSKPNRGGGRSNKRGGRGGASASGDGSDRGGGSRGRGSRGGFRGGPARGAAAGNAGGWSSSKKSDMDLEELAFGPKVNNPGHNNHKDSLGTGHGSSSGSKRSSHVKVTMQTLFMSLANQEMVRETLQSLQLDKELEAEERQDINDFNYEGGEEYDELDYRAEDQYWISDRTLIVQDAHVFGGRGTQQQEGGATKVSSQENLFAMKKLQRCGFTSDLCQEALQLTEGDVGAALEYLLNDLFNITLSPGDVDQFVDEEILEARKEEKFALESIYESSFEERIPNKCWLLNLELPALTEVIGQMMTSTQEKGKGEKEDEKNNKKKICHFYLKGKGCKFKDKCRFSHSIPFEEGRDLTHPIYNALHDAVGEKKRPPYSVEIRFPSGCRYPEEAPLIAFVSHEDDPPMHSRLNISQFLMTIAKESASQGLPCVFSVVSALEDKDTLHELLVMPPPQTSKPASASAGPVAEIRSLSLKDESKGKRPSASGTSKSSGADAQSNERNIKTKVLSVDPVPAVVPKPKRKDIGAKVQNPSEVKKQNRILIDEFKKKQSSKQYQNMLSSRKQLPAWNKRDQVCDLVSRYQVVVISGMTGCGKTTQVPQFLLDEALSHSPESFTSNIICTQPRRISAMAVAQRVADERAEKLGRSVGYQIRLESVMSQFTRLLFCTTGIILRRLESDPLLEGVTHIIIDEVHERSEESDFLLMILRDVLVDRPDLKVIMMSATLNADLFSDYFGDCPVLEIPGRTFPVQDFYLEDAIDFLNYRLEERSPYARSSKNQAVAGLGCELSLSDLDEELAASRCPSLPAGDRVLDMKLNPRQFKIRYPDVSQNGIKTMGQMDLEKLNLDLIVQLLEWITTGKHEFPQTGAILVFMPGFAEIQQLYDQLLATPEFGHRNKSKYIIIPLHSTLSSEEQNAVFSKPPTNVTKIVIATNIAETSITIDDIIYVIDAGRMKEKRFDQAKSMESLETVWVSKANALQRRGRAGRVQEGVCFHLFTSHHFKHFLREQPIPEIRRACLEQLVLKIKMLPLFEQIDVEEVLANLIEPPSAEAAKGAVKRLTDLGALDENGELTPLGYHVGSLPVDVRIGKLMLFGAIFRCLDSALTIAACLSFKSPFVTPFGLKQEADAKRKEFAMGNSDYLTMLNAYKGWMEIKSKSSHHRSYMYCQENFLSIKTLQMLGSLKQQYVELLSDIGFIRPGLRLRDMERAGRTHGSDGVAEVTGIETNVNSSNWNLMSGMLVAALFPNIVQILTPDTRYAASSSGAVIKTPNAEELKFKTKMDGYVSIHPSSVNFQIGHFSSPYLVYHEKVKTTKVYVRDSSMVSVYPLLLFGGGSMSIDLYQGSFILSVDDGWISCKAATPQIASLVRDLRSELDLLLSDKISQPDIDLLICPRGSKIINCIVSLISSQ